MWRAYVLALLFKYLLCIFYFIYFLVYLLNFIFMLAEGSSWAFHGRIDPEELFRQIFGDRGFRTSGFDDFDDFVESDFGFATASHVRSGVLKHELE